MNKLKNKIDNNTILLHIILILSAIIPATLMVVYSIYFIVILFERFFSSGINGISDILLFFIGVFGIIGYVGLVLVSGTIMRKSLKRQKWAISCLVFGIFGSILFIVLGGKSALIWIFTIEEPLEWFVFMWPTLVSIYFVIKIRIGFSNLSSEKTTT